MVPTHAGLTVKAALADVPLAACAILSSMPKPTNERQVL
jgi:hypothetical protein